jgi:hypothetical protein
MAAYEHLVKSYDVGDRDYEFFERELLADRRIHYAANIKVKALQALHRVLERERPEDPDAAAELEQLAGRLAAG